MAPIQYGTREFLLEPGGIRLVQEEHHYKPSCEDETENKILARMASSLGALLPAQRASVLFTYHAGRIQYAKLIVVTPPVTEETPA